MPRAAGAMAVSAADMLLAADSLADISAEASRAIPDLHRGAPYVRTTVRWELAGMRVAATITAGTAMAEATSSTAVTETVLLMVIPTTDIRTIAICQGLILTGGGIAIRLTMPTSAHLRMR